MRTSCAEPSVPASVSGLWLSGPVLGALLQSAEAAKVASGAQGRPGVT